MLCNAYLPSNPDRNTNILEEYAGVLNAVSVVLADTDSDFVVFDLNTDFCCVDLRSVHVLNSMLTRESLQKIDSCFIDFTFKSKINSSESVLDHFILSSNLINCMEKYLVIICLTIRLYM